MISIYFEKNAMKTAKLFRNGQSQAVRLPKEFRFEGEFVYIKKSGNAIVLLPAKGAWDSLVGSLDKFSEDFMPERSQPAPQDRETF
jgi:antitoxin VapB